MDKARRFAEVAKNVESVGERNRRALAERPGRYERNDVHYCIGRRRKSDGRIRLETIESVSVQCREDDVDHRWSVDVGKMEADGWTERSAKAQLYWRLISEIVRRKVARRAEASDIAARITWKVADWVEE